MKSTQAIGRRFERARRIADRWGRPLGLSLTLAGFGLGLYYIALLGVGNPADARAYYLTSVADPYRSHLSLESPLAYMYSPAFVQAISPLQGLALGAFLTVFRGAQVIALALLVGPFSLLALFLPPVASEINAGNIHLFLGLAIVAGFRWPALWAFVLLTKVTPGLGLLWFAVRREWRSLAIALVATGAVVIGSGLLLGVGPWIAWANVLIANSGLDHDALMPVSLPLWLRLGLAAALIVWGARTDRRGVVPIACVIALPWIWFTSLSMGLAAVPLALGDWRRNRGLVDAARGQARESATMATSSPELPGGR